VEGWQAAEKVPFLSFRGAAGDEESAFFLAFLQKADPSLRSG
jgi:hypothetical protein